MEDQTVELQFQIPVCLPVRLNGRFVHALLDITEAKGFRIDCSPSQGDFCSTFIHLNTGTVGKKQFNSKI